VPSHNTLSICFPYVSTTLEHTLIDSLTCLPSLDPRRKETPSYSNLETGYEDGNLMILNYSQRSIGLITVNSLYTSLQLSNTTRNFNNLFLSMSSYVLRVMPIWLRSLQGNVIPISSVRSMRLRLRAILSNSKLQRLLDLGLLRNLLYLKLRIDDW
jgi:hypothetical protein